jgi:hypothetical protein
MMTKHFLRVALAAFHGVLGKMSRARQDRDDGMRRAADGSYRSFGD